MNAEIAEWILAAEARTSPLEPEPQNPIAATFVTDDRGLIDIDSRAGFDEIDSAEDAQARHAELRRAVARGLKACEGNAGPALREKLERYAETLGEGPEEVRPSLVVLRGEGLRQDLAAREKDDPDSNIPPVGDNALLAFKEVVSAHNLYVGLDPALVRRDLALLGPGHSQLELSPDDVRRAAQEGRQRGVITDGAYDAIVTALENAPAVPTSADRRSRTLTESARNLARKAFALIWHHRKKLILGAAATPPVLYALGHYLLANEATWLRWFADNPTMLAIVRDIVAFLKTMPFA